MKISLIGTGILGRAIAEKLASNGFDLSVFNRTHTKTEPLASKGITVSGSIVEAFATAEVILLVLADKGAIDAVLSTEDLSFERKTIIQMGTITSQESKDLDQLIQAKGGIYAEAPVLGSRPETQAGKLIIMTGGDEAVLQRQRVYLEKIGRVYYIGSVGQAAALKLALNQLIASHAFAFSFSLGLVEKSGVNTDLFVDILQNSSLYAPMFDKKYQRWIKRDFSNPNFPTKHLLKDVALIIKEAKVNNIETHVLEAYQVLIMKSLSMGLSDVDYSSVFQAINNG